MLTNHFMKVWIQEELPIFKYWSKILPRSYRPISFISNLNEILEKN